mgnify:CR=1 FL=1
MATSNALVLGAIVTFKGNYYVALGYDGNLVTIIAPHNSQRKLNVKRSNVTVVNATPLRKVTYNGSDYLVSRKGTIISLTTNRVMNWADGNGNRRSILARAA